MAYERTETMVLKFTDKADYDKWFKAFMDEVPFHGAQILTLHRGDALTENENEVRCDFDCEECAEIEEVEQ